MRTSAAGRRFIEQFEGLALRAYGDGTGVLTIGYGHTTAAGPPPVTRGMTIARDRADTMLGADLARVEAEVNALVRVPINQNQYDALVSFQFNTGGLRRSTLLKLLNLGLPQAVPGELLKWNRAGGAVMAGLTRRRKAESELWSKPVAIDARPLQPAASPGPAPPDIEPIPAPMPPVQPRGRLELIASRVAALFRR